jgi:hypothetical protein
VTAFLWTKCLVEDWDSGTNDKTRAAFKQLTELLGDPSASAAIIARLEAEFPDFEGILYATSKANIIFRTLMAFNLSRGGTDWAGLVRSSNETQEDHHIFPRDWLSNNRDPDEDKQTWASLRDSVLNRVFVSKKANLEARAQTPPSYLSKATPAQRRSLQIPDSFLASLQIPIKSEAFSAFLRDRYDIIRTDFIDFVRQNLEAPADGK